MEQQDDFSKQLHGGVDVQRVREMFIYDELTGVISRRIGLKRSPSGTVVGTKDSYGYLVVGIDGKMHKAHRLVWLYAHGEWPSGFIDHINHNPSDNRICNLRIVSNEQNQQHQSKAHSDNKTSGMLDVCFHKRHGKFMASISIKKKVKFIWYFETAGLAHDAYIATKSKCHPAYIGAIVTDISRS